LPPIGDDDSGDDTSITSIDEIGPSGWAVQELSKKRSTPLGETLPLEEEIVFTTSDSVSNPADEEKPGQSTESHEVVCFPTRSEPNQILAMEAGQNTGLMQLFIACQEAYNKDHPHDSESERNEGWTKYWKSISDLATVRDGLQLPSPAIQQKGRVTQSPPNPRDDMHLIQALRGFQRGSDYDNRHLPFSEFDESSETDFNTSFRQQTGLQRQKPPPVDTSRSDLAPPWGPPSTTDKYVPLTAENSSLVYEAGSALASGQEDPRNTVYCKFCTEQPQGFHGLHELHRHLYDKHQARKVWICIEAEPGGTFLANCKGQCLGPTCVVEI